MSAFPLNIPGRILMATISTPDLPASQALYTDCFRYKIVDSGKVDETLANSWAAPATAGKPFALLAPRQDDSTVLRLIETEAGSNLSPLRTFGWWALELSVEDVDKIHEVVEKSDFEVVGAPRDMTFDAPVRPMQCVGPNGEVFFLTQVLEHASPESRTHTKAFVDQLFIVILGTPGREDVLRFYEQALGFERADEFEIEYRSLNWAFGLPQGTRHKLTMLDASGTGVIQVDQYPDGATERPVLPGHLPPGISMVTFVVSSLDDIGTEFLADPIQLDAKPYGGRTSAVVRGTMGELIEFVAAG